MPKGYNKFAPVGSFLLWFIAHYRHLLFAYVLVRHFTVDLPHVMNFLPVLWSTPGSIFSCIFVFPIYKGYHRVLEINDIIRIVKFAVLRFALWLGLYVTTSQRYIAFKRFRSAFFSSTCSVCITSHFIQVAGKGVYFKAVAKVVLPNRAFIYGAGAMGQVAKKCWNRISKILPWYSGISMIVRPLK